MRRALAALLLALCILVPPPLRASSDNARGTQKSFEERATAETQSRSRYRDLEVASLVLILVVGSAAILWAVRRKKP